MNSRTGLILPAVVIAVIASSLPAQLPGESVRAENRQTINQQPNVVLASGYREAETTTQDSNKRDAKRGDIASGAVLTTQDGELHLNIKPCEAQAFVVVFRQPYNRSTRGQKNCAGQNVTIEQIQQN